uniref:Capsid protein n=1 Tax=Phytophthora palustris toti-like virus 9 TaxID=2976321 RepID=A0A9E9BZY6_9VIRU|nr:capsid protein [Phytophthora palustris toti-like virus 9]
MPASCDCSTQLRGSTVSGNCKSPIGMETSVTKTTGLVSAAVPGTISSDTELHRYRAVLTSSAQINGKVDVSARSILYNIGRKGGPGSGLEDRTNVGVAIDASVRVSEVVRGNLETIARKYNALSGPWERCDFASLVAVLAAGVAHFRAHNQLTQEQLACGREMRYASVVAARRSISADGCNVFVPSSADTSMAPATIAALVAATTGAGGVLVSDLVGVNANTNAAVVPTARDADLAAGCCDALSLIAANYAAHNAGEVFMYALTVGLHRSVTLHSHTDEGGIMRDLLRACSFAPPRGGILTSIPVFTGLPDPLAGEGGFTKYVDSLVIQTAGCVALADPMCTIDGKKYPTILASTLGLGSDEPTDDDARANLAEMVRSVGDFIPLYSKLLGRIISLSGGTEVVTRHFVATVTNMVGHAYAHLKHKVVAPFMWVEPTGSTRVEVNDYAMQQEGFGRLCSVDGEVAVPAFRGAHLIGENGLVSGWRIDWRGARRHGMLQHLMCHKLDGLSNLIPRQVDSSATTLLGVGAAGRRDESLTHKLINQRGLDEYLWGRGHSSVIAPAEFINLSSSIGLAVKHGFTATNGLSIETSHAPSTSEFSQDVVFSVTALAPVGTFKAGGPDKRVDRERRVANRALLAARLRGGIANDIDAMLPIKDGAPEIGERFEDSNEMSEITVAGTEMASSAIPSTPVGVSDGAKLEVAAVHGSQSAPRVQASGPRATSAVKQRSAKGGEKPPSS